MSGSEHERGKAVSVRLLEAVNAHDLEGQLGLFKDDYRSEQPVHPARTFSGRKQVRGNWSKLYESIPDFQAERHRDYLGGPARLPAALSQLSGAPIGSRAAHKPLAAEQFETWLCALPLADRLPEPHLRTNVYPIWRRMRLLYTDDTEADRHAGRAVGD